MHRERESVSELEKKLDALGQSDGSFDSHGDFTLDPQVAYEKLRSFLLKDLADCLLRLVQAAVISGAECVEVTVPKKGLRFKANGGTGWQPEMLLNQEASEILKSPGLQAIHSLLQYGPVSYRHALNGESLELELSTGKCRRSQSGDESDVYWSIEFQGSQLRGLFAQMRQRLSYARCLEKCRFVPLKLKLDGRTLSLPFPSRPDRIRFDSYLPGTSVSVAFNLLESYTLAQPQSADMFWGSPIESRKAIVSLPERLDFQASDPVGLVSTGEGCLCHRVVGEMLSVYRPIPCQRIIRIPLSLKGPGTLRFLSAGVEVATIEREFGCSGVEVLESLGDLKTDLTGLELVNDDFLESRIQEVKTEVKEMVEIIRHHRLALPSQKRRSSSPCLIQMRLKQQLPGE